MISLDIPQTTPAPEPNFVEDQRHELLEQAIAGLPPRCRLALTLRMWDELSYAEILSHFASKGIIVNERTVRRWVAYAIEQCREKISRAEDDLEGGGQ
jgi:RNA polymerase sigma factor (sigma-70 family)